MNKEIDLRFPGVGRLRRPYGTEHEPTRKKIKAMLYDLKDQGRLDILRQLRDGVLHPLDVYDAFRGQDLARLPSTEAMMELGRTFTEWAAEYDCSEIHRVNLRQTGRYLVRGAPAGLTIADLPRRMDQLRRKMQDTPRAFNLMRSHVQAFTRSKLGRNHRVWLDVTSVMPLKTPPRRAPQPLSGAALAALLRKLPIEHRPAALGMAVTGMGPSEFWGRWEVEQDRVRIFGTKRAGRFRFVPRITTLEPAATLYPSFRRQLVKAEPGIQPYDLRRTFAITMEAVGIPRTRRRMYMGHGARDITDLYEEIDVQQFLVEDARRLREYLEANGVTLG